MGADRPHRALLRHASTNPHASSASRAWFLKRLPVTLPSLGWGHVVAVTVPVVNGVIQCFLLYANAISGATAGLIYPSPSIDPDEWISLAILALLWPPERRPV